MRDIRFKLIRNHQVISACRESLQLGNLVFASHKKKNYENNKKISVD